MDIASRRSHRNERALGPGALVVIVHASLPHGRELASIPSLIAAHASPAPSVRPRSVDGLVVVAGSLVDRRKKMVRLVDDISDARVVAGFLQESYGDRSPTTSCRFVRLKTKTSSSSRPASIDRRGSYT